MTHDPGEAGPRRPLAIRWSRRAKADLEAIGDYVAADNPSAARHWIERLIADVERAAEMPLAGRVVPEFAGRQDIREVLRGTYRVVYRVRTDAIEVLTLFEGHRLFPRDVVPAAEVNDD